MAEPVPVPSRSGSVVLEVGPGVGALVLYTPPELDGSEIEISRHESEDGQRQGRRTHSRVRQRHTSAGTTYAAVYPGLAAGTYTIWRDAARPATTVVVDAGQAATAWWPPGPPGMRG
jgi:hypothetical protein